MAVVTVARMGKDCREAGWTDARRFYLFGFRRAITQGHGRQKPYRYIT